jgi:hypothetical protein
LFSFYKIMHGFFLFKTNFIFQKHLAGALLFRSTRSSSTTFSRQFFIQLESTPYKKKKKLEHDQEFSIFWCDWFKFWSAWKMVFSDTALAVRLKKKFMFVYDLHTLC